VARARPTTRYARSGDYSIAYQVVGDGPLDLVYVPGFVSHVEHAWEDPDLARFLNRLASFSRLILFDKRGTGLSDRVPVQKLPISRAATRGVTNIRDLLGFSTCMFNQSRYRPALAGSTPSTLMVLNSWASISFPILNKPWNRGRQRAKADALPDFVLSHLDGERP